MPPKTNSRTTDYKQIQTLTTGLIKQMKVAKIFGISTQAIHKLLTKAKGRDYSPWDYRTLKLEHVIDETSLGESDLQSGFPSINAFDRSINCRISSTVPLARSSTFDIICYI